MDIAQIIELISVLATLATLFKVLVELRGYKKTSAEEHEKEKIEEALWRQSVNVRLDSHNHYAEKFAEYGIAISALQTDVAEIKGTLKKGE